MDARLFDETWFWHFNCCLERFIGLVAVAEKNRMKKSLLLLAAFGCSIFWTPTYATTVTIDLGPPSRVTGEKIVSFNDLNDIQFSGQTLFPGFSL